MRTPRSSGLLARPFVPASLAFGIVATASAIPVGCSSGETSSDAPQRALPGSDPSAEESSAALARSIRARFPAAFAQPAAPASGPAEAKVTLPSSAKQPFRLRDRASKIEIGVALEGAADVEATRDGDLVLFERAAPGDGDLVHRIVPEGVEDLVHFAARPSLEKVSYVIEIGTAAGLRLVSNTLEVLDAKGSPVLRAAPPYVLDAAGEQHAATLDVTGCAVDTDPRAPFRRAVTPPGARSCTVVVDWSAAHVSYPALVDPVWGSTFNTMAVARTHHTITLLNPTDAKSLALVAGGASAVNGAPLKSAEIYDPLSRRFSSTGQMNVARSAHTTTLLTVLDPGPALGPIEPALVAGGADAGGNPISSIEVFDPASGTFVLDANTMATPRFEHVAVLVGTDEVLIAGGTTPPLNQPTNTSYVYTFQGFGSGSPPTSVTSTLVAVVDPMKSARTGLAATRLGTGQVLLTGGFVLAGGALQALQSAELFNPVDDTYSDIATAGTGVDVMATQRGYHTSTALGTSGKVLIAGGLSKTVGGIYTNTVDIYDSAAANKGFVPQPVPITMLVPRANHSATLLPDGRVLVAGGFNNTPSLGAVGAADVFDPATSTFEDVLPLVPMAPRGDFAALLVNAGDSVNAGFTVLVTGGASSPTTGAAATASAQILLRIDGDECTIDEDCLSGFCTDNVCCNKRCDEECYACHEDLKQSGDQSGVCSFAKQGADPHQQCLNNVETHTMCDGFGSTEQDPTLTKSCLPGICAGDELSCSTSCQTTANCDLTGWCDVDGKEGDPNQCAPKKVNGAPCDLDEECVNTRCVDKVCCNADCDLQCQACNLNGLVGTCSFVGTAANPGDVQPNTLTGAAQNNVTGPRTACNGVAEDGSKSACTGACTGEQLCTYPTATSFLQADTCADDPAGGPSVLTSFPCDGDGSNTSTTATCAGFKCESETACRTTCALDADCITNFVCTAGACVELTEPLCDGIKTLRNRVENGGYQVCPDSYACPPGANACLTECASINDCIQPDALPEGDEDDKVAIVCNGERKCVPEPEPPVLESCSASPAGTGRSSAAWLAGLLVALAAATRRSRASRARPRA